jgi:hypothetical protein
MPYFGFNFVDTFQIKVAAFGNGLRGVLRDNPGIGKREASSSLLSTFKKSGKNLNRINFDHKC